MRSVPSRTRRVCLRRAARGETTQRFSPTEMTATMSTTSTANTAVTVMAFAAICRCPASAGTVTLMAPATSP